MINIENFNYEFPLITISYLLAVTFIGFIIEYVISEKNRKAGNRWGIFLSFFGFICFVLDMLNIQNNNYDFPWITVCYLVPSVFMGIITEYIAKKKNIKNGFLWGFFLLPIGLIAVGFLPNENPIKCYMFNGVIQNADAIKKYKELLDMGAITQEEFETKKKELLKEHS